MQKVKAAENASNEQLESPRPALEVAPNVHAVTVLVCQGCIDLDGEECHTPECVFCFRGMGEVRYLLDKMLICPIIDGERIVLAGDDVSERDADTANVR